MMAIQGLTTDEVAAYLEDEGQMYQLTEGEITQLKHLVELQLLLEADPEIGVIEGADEVLNLMARYVIYELLNEDLSCGNMTKNK